MKHFVVTIAREYGSKGHAIGKLLAEKLNVPYYDRDLVELAAAKLDKNIDEVIDVDESHTGGIYNFLRQSTGVKLSEEVIEAQSEIIRKKAEKESCIIIGRGADFVLRGRKDCIYVLIKAPFEERVKNIYEKKKEEGKLPKKIETQADYNEVNITIAAEIKKVDAERDRYYKYVSGYERNSITGKHIIIDSSLLGVEKTAEVLKEIVLSKFK